MRSKVAIFPSAVPAPPAIMAPACPIRFPEGAVAYGTILSTWAAGSLVGMALAGVLPRPDPKRMGAVLLSLVSVMGIGLALLGLSNSMIFAAGIGLVLGALASGLLLYGISMVYGATGKLDFQDAR